jgi:hypothetical protein
MPRDGALTLGDYPSDTVQLSCSKCWRIGRLRLARLIAEHGRDAKLTDLQHILVRCHMRGNERDPCGVFFVDLSNNRGVLGTKRTPASWSYLS